MKWIASRSLPRRVVRVGTATPTNPPAPDDGYKRNVIGFARR